MALKERIESDMRASAKARDVIKRDTLRFALAAIHNDEVARRRDLTDDELLQVLAKQAKMRRESIEAFEKGGRDDLVAKEAAELDVIQGYLPRQLGRDEVAALAESAVRQSGATSPADQGKVMQKLMPQVKGRAEGRLVAEVVGSLLRAAAPQGSGAAAAEESKGPQ